MSCLLPPATCGPTRLQTNRHVCLWHIADILLADLMSAFDPKRTLRANTFRVRVHSRSGVCMHRFGRAFAPWRRLSFGIFLKLLSGCSRNRILADFMSCRGQVGSMLNLKAFTGVNS
jgi:hypothetical protein